MQHTYIHSLGDLPMMNNIGAALKGGKSVFGPKNESLAAHFFLFAASQGHIGAVVNLASCYADGEGLPRSISKALQWFKYAASRNHQGVGTDFGLVT